MTLDNRKVQMETADGPYTELLLSGRYGAHPWGWKTNTDVPSSIDEFDLKYSAEIPGNNLKSNVLSMSLTYITYQISHWHIFIDCVE